MLHAKELTRGSCDATACTQIRRGAGFSLSCLSGCSAACSRNRNMGPWASLRMQTRRSAPCVSAAKQADAAACPPEQADAQLGVLGPQEGQHQVCVHLQHVGAAALGQAHEAALPGQLLGHPALGLPSQQPCVVGPASAEMSGQSEVHLSTKQPCQASLQPPGPRQSAGGKHLGTRCPPAGPMPGCPLPRRVTVEPWCWGGLRQPAEEEEML